MGTKSTLTKSLSCLLFLLAIAFCPAATGKTIHVDDDGPADFNTIQASINDANDGDTVVVAPGIYTGDGNRDIDFKGKAITVKSEEGPQTCIIDCQGTKDNPHRGLYFHSGEDANSIIQGFTITDGFIIRHEPGGGIFCENSSPQIIDCIIVGNEARTGGGIATTDSSAQIINCIVQNNIAADGGGIEIGTNDDGTVLIKGCIITDNHAVFHPRFGGEGGGIIVYSHSHIINCTIIGNIGGYTGGGICFRNGTYVSNSIIWGNTFHIGYGNEIALMYSPAYWKNPSNVIIKNSLVGSGTENDFGFLSDSKQCLEGEWLQGNPMFARNGHWDPNVSDVPRSNNNPIWVDGDYHLKSQAGRWDSNSGSWMVDYVTSPCIDAGDPNVPVGDEPEPNGGIINMGAYGGTLQASKSYILSKIIYVDDDAAGLNDGSSWQNAYTFLQDALADARIAKKPVEIRVAQGVYKPDQGTGVTPNNQNATFQLINGTILKGGFAGFNEPDPNVNDTGLYESILSGNDNNFMIVTCTAANPNTVIDGFVIMNAKDIDSQSGGIYIYENGNITIKNCLFTLNETRGIYSENSSPIVTNCTFTQNTDGGIFIDGGNPRITDCIFSRNLSWTGAGLYSVQAFLWLENCVFIQNEVFPNGWRCPNPSGTGGALYCCDSLSGSTIKGCAFYDNTAISGGGAYLGTCSSILPISTPDREEEIFVIDCSFVRNRANYGGALMQTLYTTRIENSVFYENSASYRGGVVLNTCGRIGLINCVLGGNSAGSLGAVAFNHGIRFPNYPPDYFFDLTLSNCTLIDNIAPLGRMVTCRSEGTAELDSVQISNCIISNGGNEIYNPDGSKISIHYTNLLGGLSTIDDPCNTVVWGIENIDVDPLFVDPGYWDPNGTQDDPNDDLWVDGDYHLKSQAGRWDPNSGSWIVDDVTSPCIDAGDPNSPIGHEPFPNGGIVNMGAYGGTPEASKSFATISSRF